MRLKSNLSEEWFKEEEIDRYIQVKYMQKNINIAQNIVESKVKET